MGSSSEQFGYQPEFPRESFIPPEINPDISKMPPVREEIAKKSEPPTKEQRFLEERAALEKHAESEEEGRWVDALDVLQANSAKITESVDKAIKYAAEYGMSNPVFQREIMKAVDLLIDLPGKMVDLAKAPSEQKALEEIMDLAEAAKQLKSEPMYSSPFASKTDPKLYEPFLNLLKADRTKPDHIKLITEELQEHVKLFDDASL